MTEDTNTSVTEKPAENAAVVGSPALPQDELNKLTDDIVAALKTVYDPEIPADIYELGLIYKIDIGDDRGIKIDMSLTSPNCPAAQELPIMVENAVSSVPGVKETKVAVVWDPPWDPSRMSDEARLVLAQRRRKCIGEAGESGRPSPPVQPRMRKRPADDQRPLCVGCDGSMFSPVPREPTEEVVEGADLTP